jgi:hypothetical protein
MTCYSGHGSDALTHPRNEKARRAGTRRAVFVFLSRRPAGCAFHGHTQQTDDTSERCTDGIDILLRRP